MGMADVLAVGLAACAGCRQVEGEAVVLPELEADADAGVGGLVGGMLFAVVLTRGEVDVVVGLQADVLSGVEGAGDEAEVAVFCCAGGAQMDVVTCQDLARCEGGEVLVLLVMAAAGAEGEVDADAAGLAGVGVDLGGGVGQGERAGSGCQCFDAWVLGALAGLLVLLQGLVGGQQRGAGGRAEGGLAALVVFGMVLGLLGGLEQDGLGGEVQAAVGGLQVAAGEGGGATGDEVEVVVE